MAEARVYVTVGGTELLRELAEWRSGARRVFWRVRWWEYAHDGELIRGGARQYDSRARAALEVRRHVFPNEAKLYRVVVRPKAKP